MSYFLNLFSPETHAAFSASDRSVSGFRERHRKAAQRIEIGDFLVCYLTRVSRWVGLFQVIGQPFEDRSPLFLEREDPFFVRFKVEPLVWLPPEHGIPIHHDSVWPHLSFTRGHERDSTTWTGSVRTSLARMNDEDGRLLEKLLRAQSKDPMVYPLDASERKALQHHRVRRADGEIVVTVPENAPPLEAAPTEPRESIGVQALSTRSAALCSPFWKASPSPNVARFFRTTAFVKSLS